ncbi:MULTISPECIES: SDR family NAD(P)-dependent oxidoreductase [unclassified Streptomyces]|uniref:SDR family NAD(P)-dependent oxidoreductase n=1 Tax=unclassified Streptomyces TaxID=2593676 RepID=UPI001BE85101|nr:MULTISPECIES: SDR family NAD(P)-dependent oxidoreductase [unclassified Streptomyces]MBT2404440.1 SDR family NAD(P)-dependent oxidoreductase [Streptomyces sp. ISL-21]MBT2612506.1 SDR family NAD(P)-dependent oxidoreductase [Streptomyces sp. ISL-87]
MLNDIRREAITMVPEGTRVPLRHLCREQAGTTGPAPGASPGAAADVDEDLLSRLLFLQLKSAGQLSGEAPAPLPGGGLRRWLDESVRRLRAGGFLSGSPSRPVPAVTVDSSATWSQWEQYGAGAQGDAAQRARFTLLDATLRALSGILRGEVLATDVMFPDSSMELVERIYRDNPLSDCFNGILADAVAAVVREIVRADPAARIRILEIGAGTGGGSVTVLERLEPFAAHVETYSYTDLSKSFLMYAEAEYGPRHPYLDYRLFDVEEPLAAQGIAPGSYDLVLATNVLHATKDIRRTLRNAKGALKRHGVLLANELSTHSLFTHLTFGLLDGWWLYEDDELRMPGGPGLSPDTWEEVLDDEGFGSVSFPARRLHELGYQVIAAASDGLVRQEEQEAAAPTGETVGEGLVRPGVQEAAASGDAPEQRVRETIFEQLRLSLKIDRSQIAADDAFMDYGVDSIIGVRLIQEINRALGTDLATTDLFDHGSVSRLARHIVDHALPAAPAAPAVPLPTGQRVAPEELAPPSAASRRAARPDAGRTAAGGPSREPIAVVGMSGRFAGSAGVEQLWEHLAQGHDLTGPVLRWDLSGYRPADAQSCERGSFIDGIDRFDPAFFNISGVEATYMDPQQRLFLEESWKALEDAGYAGSGTRGRRVGVYVGCQESGYAQLFGAEAPPQSMWGNALSAMPARISYHLDLQGPAIAVDTACSSSLVALHLACQGLWGGETEMALAGGVSLQCTPQFYVLAGRAGMLSPSGRCHTFDDRADGFVPGEGVGVLVLKRLSDALADGDHIRGVISGSGINQDGASNGITAPSAASQERLETSVYDTFGIRPDDIQMMEAHGTGTELGDPIEYRALQRAFRRYTDRRDYCALGSVKSNLGHTITAAGVAGAIKVLLSLEHRTIPPSINFERANAHIDMSDTPFYVNTVNRPWAAGNDGTRRAAVSSFGVSGTNAHIVFEEAPAAARPSTASTAHLVTLSAVTAGQLVEQAERLIEHCEQRPGLDPGDIAFTLLLGRRHLAHRLAFVVRDSGELVRTLRTWLDGAQSPRMSAGEVPAQGIDERAALRKLGNDSLRQAATDPASRTELLSTVADLYVQGYDLDYAALFAADHHARVPLPTYPFARERYWVSDQRALAAARPGTAEPHPLLHEDVSDFGARRYRTRFTGEEHYLTDHVVKGRKVLPGVACLEMARAAAALTLGTPEPGGGADALALRNVVWARPVAVDDEPVTLVTSLVPTGPDEADYEITGTPGPGPGAAPVVHSQGQVVRRAVAPALLDVPALRAACGQGELTAAELYRAYEAIGFRYGPSHRGLERLHVGRGQILARLVLPGSVRAARGAFVLHPSLLDATLQASLGIGLATGAAEALDVSGMKPSLPFALDELEVLGDCPESMWAWIRFSAGSRADGTVFKLDIDLCDDQGRVCVRIRGMSYRVLEGEVGGTGPDEVSCVSFLPVWREAFPGGDPDVEPRERVVLLPDLPDLGELLARQDPAARLLRLTSAAPGIAERFTEYTVQALDHLRRLMAEGVRHGVRVQLVVPDESGLATTRGLLGLLKSAQAEEPGLLPQVVVVDPDETAEQMMFRLAAARRHPDASCLRFRAGRVEALGWREDDTPAEARVPWRSGGVYLVTGGLGGLGTLVARDMAACVRDVKIVLAGRSPLGPEQESVLDALRDQGADVRHARVDVTRAAAVRSLVDGILREHGTLHGIIHAAGVLRDGLVRGKTAEECRAVLAPKVAGLVNLDEASKDVPLDFLLSFSGAAGVFGNAGQSDYAAANAFLDAYTHHRRQLVDRGERSGASVSVDWPLWAEGGMRVDPGTEAVMRERLGMAPMPTTEGMGALYAALAAPHSQVLVVAGDAGRIRRTVLGRPAAPEAPRPAPPRSAAPVEAPAAGRSRRATGDASDPVRTALVARLRQTLSEVIQLPGHRIDAAAPFEQFGIDSVLALSLTNRLEADFGSLSKTLFFEYRNLHELSAYFLQAHADAVRMVVGDHGEPDRSPAPEGGAPVTVVRPSAPLVVPSPAEPVRPATREDAIAVIGLAGRYPGAEDLDGFWENLAAGRDCVTEVPPDRWEHRPSGGSDRNQPGGAPAQWGGFLDGAADFDAPFFNVSPREAAIMDPQTRLFLECVWTLLEDSGYTRDRLRDVHGSRVGVYVGAMYQHYQLLSSDLVHESITSVMSYSAIANRVSHFFDLQGPSLAIDTTCSSSLVAIHMACEELRRGGSEMMIAGGVNLSLHPKKYQGLSLTGLTGSGRDSRALLDGDGFICAEGVGAVLLKPLSSAVRDGDEILAVIRSSATNHKGRTSGPMVPSPARQERLIVENLERAGIHPRTISYAEVSANGSQMGDAIEFAALRDAFGEHTRDEGFCAVGTVKSTLGNMEAASGIAQLSKVVLQLGHRRLVPFVGKGRLNPGVELAGTAFYLPQEAEPWHRPVVNLDGQEREYPLRATINSFGAGGSNAHLIVEEYVGEPGADDAAAPGPLDAHPMPQIVLLSARTEDRLRAVASRLLEFVPTQADLSLEDLAHTLQCGREAMHSRLALVAGNLKELVEGLAHYLDGSGGTAPVPLFTGDAGRNDPDLELLLGGRAGEALVRELLAENHLEKLALLWARGGKVPWASARRGERNPRMLRSLPAYPFDRKRYWVPVPPGGDATTTIAAPAATAPAAVTAPATGTAPAGGAADRITVVVAELLGMRTNELDLATPLEDLGFSSIHATQLLQALQAEVDPTADLDALSECRSTRDLLRRFGSGAGASAGSGTAPVAPVRIPEVVHLGGGREGRPVFWFHGGLGGVEVYATVTDCIERPFYGIQARGWMTNSEPLHGIPALATHYAQIIRTVQPEGPYDLGGYSFGGLLAYEVTRRLQEQGGTVESIVMVDTYDDSVGDVTMSRTDMLLQQVNALLFAASKPAPKDFATTLLSVREVDWDQEEDDLLDQMLTLARQRGLKGDAQTLRARVLRNLGVQEAYGLLDYDITPLPRPESVACFYFRNRSGLFYGEMEPLFSTQKDGAVLDNAVYWAEWQRQLPNFHQVDVDSANHFVMLGDPAALTTVRSFCKLLYSGKRDRRLPVAKAWATRHQKARDTK